VGRWRHETTSSTPLHNHKMDAQGRSAGIDGVALPGACTRLHTGVCAHLLGIGMNPRELLDRPDWMRYAACKGLTDLFYPGQGVDNSQAVRVCSTCPVRQRCLEAAHENTERFGVWGGQSVRERQRNRKHAA
jgi:WhiB family redox-sensing transcriptional regulator